MTISRIAMLTLLLLPASFMRAQEKTVSDASLLLHYDFSKTTTSIVYDVSASKKNALLKNNAKVISMGEHKVLSLGTANGYLDMTQNSGRLFREHDTISISLYYRIDAAADITGNGNFLFAFTTSWSADRTSGRFTAYRLNAQQASTSTGGYGTQQTIAIGTASDKDRWVHVAYVQEGKVARLYIDGKQVGISRTMDVNSTNFGTTTVYGALGRSPFPGDAYLKNTLISDFRLYGRALTAAEVAALSSETEALDRDFRYGTAADFTKLKATLATAMERMATARESGNYTENALAEYQDAITVAQLLADEGTVSQTVADTYEANLRTAYTKLLTMRGKGYDGSGASRDYATDRGFIHPGGIHTEADFTRVRQQIADRNSTILQALAKLKATPFVNLSAQPSPTVEVSRASNGGGTWIPVAQDICRAYQCALLWKLEGNERYAKKSIEILNAWARTHVRVTGGEYPLCGIYGGQLAQVAEIMRTYDGWAAEDFEAFKLYMRCVWYPFSIEFLRWREGTWVNATGDGHRASHWWSNWGLCNAWSLVSIGVLLDDTYIYNTGLSYIKDDIEGDFDPERPGDFIRPLGPTEFMGNLVPITFPDERGPYGYLGQMQESGRDQGHCLMSIGMITDICLTAWNQGDDLFSYMDNRLAAGIEFVAAYNFGDVDDLPWKNYKYTEWSTPLWDGWLMTGPSAQTRGGIRKYWGKIVGHYEGVKGVRMQYSEMAQKAMGIDTGGEGGVTGNYDAMGFSVLMNTRPFPQPDEVPTLLHGQIILDGTTLDQCYYGGLAQNFEYKATTAAAPGQTLTLVPVLPEGVEDTGQWLWNTGATTRTITVTTDRSYAYRATYTNAHGVQSHQLFTIATAADCTPDPTPQTIYNGSDKEIGTTEATVFFGDAVRLHFYSPAYYGFHHWDTGLSGEQKYDCTIPCLTTDRTIHAYYLSQGGRKCPVEFRLKVTALKPSITIGTTELQDTLSVIAVTGSNVKLSTTVSTFLQGGTYEWDGDPSLNTPGLALTDIQHSEQHTVRYTSPTGMVSELTFMVEAYGKTDEQVQDGSYRIRDIATDCYLTALISEDEGTQTTSLRFLPLMDGDAQVWHVSSSGTPRYDLQSASTGLYLNPSQGKLVATTYKPCRIRPAIGTDHVALYGSTGNFWAASDDGTIDFKATTAFAAFPFQLINTNGEDIGSNIMTPKTGEGGGQWLNGRCYDLSGRPMWDGRSAQGDFLFPRKLPRGLYIVGGRKVLVQ